jgi:tripartite-type tricarboxylate transporter receptor subunit TctC
MDFRIYTKLVSTWFLLLASSLINAQTFPNKPIKVIVPTASGGPSDSCMRAVVQAMQSHLGQSITIENVTGATGSIGLNKVASSPADGYTLVVPSAANTASLATRPNISFDVMSGLKPIGKICNATQTLVVSPTLGIKSVEELIKYAKSNPGKISFGSIGIGSSQHLVGEMFAVATNIDMQHIPFRGEALAATEIAAGRVQLMFMAGAKPFIDNKLVMGLATTNKDTWAPMPNLPSLAKTNLPGFTYNGWNGIMAPAGTPDQIVQILSKALAEALKDEKVRTVISSMGNMPALGTPEELSDQMKSDIFMFKKIIKDRNLNFNE